MHINFQDKLLQSPVVFDFIPLYTFSIHLTQRTANNKLKLTVNQKNIQVYAVNEGKYWDFEQGKRTMVKDKEQIE